MAKRGKEFERETAALAGDYGMRIPLSGSVKGVPELAGDVRWKLPYLSEEIHIECKHGYSDKGQERKSMRIEREWFDKHMKEAKQMGFYPVWAMKFKFTAENGMSKFVCIPFGTMKKILEDMNNMYLELQEFKGKKGKR